MPNISWDDYRIAFQVAKSGTLTKAGIALQMNHSTVLRHVNRLESLLEVKLFIRHQRGYQLTDAGELLMEEFPKISHQFNQLEDLLNSAEKNISGNLRITTVPDHPPLLTPAFKAFRQAYPKLRIQIIATDEILSLASGAAHVSIRVGAKPHEPDLIVKKLADISIQYYAAQSYIDQYGLPTSTSEFRSHLWALPSTDKRHIPFVKSVLEYIDEEHIIYQSNNFPDIVGAVAHGMAIGPVADYKAEEIGGLTALEFMTDIGDEALWFVYHKDLKSSARIKALYGFLQEGFVGQPPENAINVK